MTESVLCPFSFPPLTLLPLLHLSVISPHSSSIISYHFSTPKTSNSQAPFSNTHLYPFLQTAFYVQKSPKIMVQYPCWNTSANTLKADPILLPIMLSFTPCSLPSMIFSLFLFSYLLKSFCLCLLSIYLSRGIVHAQSSYSGGLTPW